METSALALPRREPLPLFWPPFYSSVFASAYVLSHVWLFATPWTVACQPPLSVGFSRQEYLSGLPFPSPGDLPNPGIKSTSPTYPALAGRFFTIAPPRRFQSVDLCRPGFLSLDTIDIWGWAFLSCRGCSVPCSMVVGSVSDLYPVAASSTTSQF